MEFIRSIYMYIYITTGILANILNKSVYRTCHLQLGHFLISMSIASHKRGRHLKVDRVILHSFDLDATLNKTTFANTPNARIGRCTQSPHRIKHSKL